MAKDNNLVAVLWGKGAHLSNIAPDQSEASLLYQSSMCELCDEQIVHNKLWIPNGIAGIKDVNIDLEITLPGADGPTTIAARAVLLQWVPFAPGIPLFGEVHQRGPGADVDVVIPNCTAAVEMVAQLNKNPAVFLLEGPFHAMGLNREWGEKFVAKLFDSSYRLHADRYSWDPESRTMKSPHDEQEKQRKALMEQDWAKAVLAAPKAGLVQEENYLPVETFIKAAKASGKDDASITTINTRNRRGGGRATTAFGRGNYKGDEGAPTLMLGKDVCAGEATARSATGGSDGEDGDDGDDVGDDASAVSDMTTMSGKSIKRGELEELRMIRDLLRKGQVVDVSAIDFSKLEIDPMEDLEHQGGT